MTAAEPSWEVYARVALREAIAGNPVQAGLQVARMTHADQSGTALIQASLLWIDTLLQVTPPPPPPVYVPEVVPQMRPAQLWALRLIAGRINADMEGWRKLFAEAASGDADYLNDRLAALVTVIAMKIGGRL